MNMPFILRPPSFRSVFYRFSYLSRILLLCIAACASLAAAAPADPPGRVGRVSFVQGAVSFFNDPAEGWRRAALNYPVTGQNSIWTESAARAEVRIGPSAIRVDSDAVLDFIVVDDERTHALLQRGVVNIRLRSMDGGDTRETFLLETTAGRITLDGNGRYRIDVTQNGQENRVTVFAGRARFNGSGNDLIIDAGRTLLVRSIGAIGTTADFRFEPATLSAFDQWASARDQSWDETHNRYASSQIISPYMTGYEDLDRYGEWVDNREYGRLWAPTLVIANWAPYRFGHWTYVRPWGWTWVDDATWGFAPFHYGRWVLIGSRWHWSPGQYWRRPVYAPALVAWHGFPNGTEPGYGAATSTIGWFPLGPREYYVPHYTANIHYIRNINCITNTTTVIRPPVRYVNVGHGHTHVPPHVFSNRTPVGSNVLSVVGEPSAVTMTPPQRKPLAIATDGARRTPNVVSPAPQVAGAPASPITSTTPAPAPTYRAPRKPMERGAAIPNPGQASLATESQGSLAVGAPVSPVTPVPSHQSQRKPAHERASPMPAPSATPAPSPAPQVVGAPVGTPSYAGPGHARMRTVPENVSPLRPVSPPVNSSPGNDQVAAPHGKHEKPQRPDKHERNAQPGAIQ